MGEVAGGRGRGPRCSVATKHPFVSESSTLSDASGWAEVPTAPDPCPRCDVLIGLEGLAHVECVERGQEVMTVTVSTPWRLGPGTSGCSQGSGNATNTGLLGRPSRLH